MRQKLAETEVIAKRFRSEAEKEHRLEHRTDGTDAFDTLYIGCEKFPYTESASLNEVV